MAAHINIFNGSAVQYFGVPHELVGTKHGSPMREMSHNALKLALVLYSKMNRSRSTVVTLDRAAIEQRSGINKQAVVKTVKELESFRIAQVTAKKGIFTFTMQDPATGKTLSSLNPASIKDGVLTEEEVVTIAEAFGLGEVGTPTAAELKSLGKAARVSTGGKLKFYCPCHHPSDAAFFSTAKGKVKAGETAHIRGKDCHISATQNNGHWVYRCEFPGCRLNGKRRLEVVENSWNEYDHEVVTGGSGSMIDLVANLMLERDGTPVTRQKAKAEMDRILG
jgi:hypothetical protein